MTGTRKFPGSEEKSNIALSPAKNKKDNTAPAGIAITSATITAFILLFSVTAFAGSNDPALQAQAKKWIEKKNTSAFEENRGQMMDMEGKPVPFVLFKAEAPGLNLWVTETGITLQTLKIEEEREKEKYSEQGREAKPMMEEEKITLRWERIDMELKGAVIKKENIIKEKPSQQGHFNYFYPHCPGGIYGVKEYEKITVKDVYPGIDWVWYYHPEKGYKYDFVVHPGSDYKQIELLYKSKTPININGQGQLELYTLYGNIKENTPVSYFSPLGGKGMGEALETHFKRNYQRPITIHSDNGYETSISFYLPPMGELEGGGTLVIDPQLWWATFYGGSGDDFPMSIDTDASGNVFVAGYTGSTNFPVQSAGTFFQGTFGGGTYDAFILKFDNNGTHLWATYYGGSAHDYGYSIATDNSGNVFVTGSTSSTNFPLQNAGTTFGGFYDAFILKFDNTGNRLWATYYGGSAHDYGYSIATDNSGNVFVTGSTSSTNFPLQNAGTFFQGTQGGFYDAFILKFDNTGNRLWATYYGGSDSDYSYSIATDNSGNVFVTGSTRSTNFPLQNAGTFFQGTFGGGTYDAFILKFDNNGTHLWATYYGGSAHDYGYSIATDNSGNVFVTGLTESTNFPIQNTGTFFQGSLGGQSDAFILKFNNNGNRMWATYYGGEELEYMRSYDNLTIDNCGNVYVGCETYTYSFPHLITSCDAGYYDNTKNTSPSLFSDLLISLFTNTGVLLWCTYFGGDGSDTHSSIAVDTNNNLFMTGTWPSIFNSTCPVINPGGGAYYDPTYNGGSYDVFMAKFLNHSCICSLTPVELLFFKGRCGNRSVELMWQTASELNNHYFNIERKLPFYASSMGELLWESVGIVQGAGNSSTIRNYEFIDFALFLLTDRNEEELYYRLRQVDYDGGYEYYGPIAVYCKTDNELELVMQNVIYDEFVSTLILPEQELVYIEIADLMGRKLAYKQLAAVKGSNLLTFDLTDIAGGVYFIQVKSKQKQLAKKFVKQ